AKRRIVDVAHRSARIVQDQVVTLRVLTQLLSREAEVVAAWIAELGRNLAADVVVRRDADLVLAVRRKVPGGKLKLHPLALSRRIERLDRDRLDRRQAGVDQLVGPEHGALLRRAVVDP